MGFWKFLFGAAFLLGSPLPLLAWGGPEHSTITSAALSVLSPAVLAFLGCEARRLVGMYCQYPDINWCVYGTCAKTKAGNVRIPDERRDYNASFYCDFDEFTGKGGYSGHGPEIGKEMPPPDEHSVKMYRRGDFAARSARKFLLRCDDAFRRGSYFDAIRFMGVVIHYLEDSTPPPHTLAIPGGSNHLHHQMEAIADHSKIGISGYVPKLLAPSFPEAAEAAAGLSDRIALESQGIAREMIGLIDSGRIREAEEKTVFCANIAAKAAADLMHTVYELNKHSLPVRPLPQAGRNLLFNPSFDEDWDGDMQPDGWVREWNDLSCPCDMHLWDRVSPDKGACVRLYGVPGAGAAWRTSKAYGIPVQAGQRFTLSGRIRLQCATGGSCLALRFQDAEYRTITEVKSVICSGKEFWRGISVDAVAPEGSTDMLAVCETQDNSGSVLFDDLDLRLR